MITASIVAAMSGMAARNERALDFDPMGISYWLPSQDWRKNPGMVQVDPNTGEKRIVPAPVNFPDIDWDYSVPEPYEYLYGGKEFALHNWTPAKILKTIHLWFFEKGVTYDTEFEWNQLQPTVQDIYEMSMKEKIESFRGLARAVRMTDGEIIFAKSYSRGRDRVREHTRSRPHHDSA